MSVSSDEINLLIQRYFQELGYNHSAFSFGSESHIPKKKIAERNVPPGALVYLIQKGIMFSQIETSAEEAVNQPDELFGHELNYLRSNLKQSVEIANESNASTRRMKILRTADSSSQPVILSYQSSFILQGHFGPVTTTAWNSDSTLLATGSCDGKVIVWNLIYSDKNECEISDDPTILTPETNEDNPSDITALSFSPDNILAVGTFSGLIVLYKDGEEIYRSNKHESPVISLSWKEDKLASGALNGSLIITGANEIIAEDKLDGEINDVAWTNSGVIASVGKTVFLLSQESEKATLIHTLPSNVTAVAGLDDTIAAADDLGNVLIGKSGEEPNIEQAGHSPAICMVLTTTGAIIGFADGTVSKVNTKVTPFPPSSKLPVHAIAADPKDRYIAAAGADGLLSIYDAGGARIVVSFIAEEGVNSVSWDSKGRFLVAGLGSGSVAVIDFEYIC